MDNFYLGKSSYANTGAKVSAPDTSAHDLISILLEELVNLLDEICVLQWRGGSPPVVEQRMMAFTILDSLTLSLDMEQGGELAQNLQLIYGQVRQLLASDHPAHQLQNAWSAHQIISEISSAWSEIG